MHDRRLRPRFGLERGRREDHPRHHRVALGQLVNDEVESVEIPEHRNAADGLAAVGGRWRQYADRPGLFHRAALNGAQQHFGIGGAAKDESGIGFRRAGVMSGARITEVAIGDPRPAQKHHLQKPVEQNGGFAEEELAEHIRRHQHIIQRHQRHRQHGRGAENVHQVGKRCEAPLQLVEMEEEINDAGIDDESRQEREQRVLALGKTGGFKTQVKTCQYRRSRRNQVMRDDQKSAHVKVLAEHMDRPAEIFPRHFHSGLCVVAPPRRRRLRKQAAPQRL